MSVAPLLGNNRCKSGPTFEPSSCSLLLISSGLTWGSSTTSLLLTSSGLTWGSSTTSLLLIQHHLWSLLDPLDPLKRLTSSWESSSPPSSWSRLDPARMSIEGLKAECTRRFDHESVALPLSHPCFPLWPNEFEELTRRTRSGLNACMSGASKDHGRSAHDLSIRSRSLYHWAIIISLLPSLTKGVWRRRKNASVYERSMEARV